MVSDKELDIEARLAARQKPEGINLMHQDWHDLLFLHWEIDAAAIRKLIPEKLSIDTFDGKAWLTVTPLTITNVRPPYMPPVPYMSWLYELNVRTYVHYNGVPGVWFFSLDANHALAVWGARTFFSLPYFEARIMCEKEDADVRFWSARSSSKAEFSAGWSVGNELPPAAPGSLEFFLVERYCLYSAERNSIYRARIFHQPWPLQEALNVSVERRGVLPADGLPLPTGEPMSHCGGPVFVDVWPPEKVA